jgi:ketosteroid isomerase-like protein
MNASTTDFWMSVLTNCVSRRTALRGLGGGSLAAALAFRAPFRAGASSEDRIAHALFGAVASDDPVAVIDSYIAAVNAGDLEAILDLYADDAVHIFLPTPDGSAGVCLGKSNFQMWYEQSLANGDRVELEDGTLAVDGNQATFITQISSEPWSKLGLEALEAHSEIVVIDGRIVTHVVVLTPDSMRELQGARGTTSA